MQSKKKIWLFVAIMIAFSLSSSLTYALKIDAQNTTKCDLDYCETTVQLDKYLTSPQLTTVKSLNLTSFLPSKTLNLKGIKYKFDGNTIIIYGNIKPFSSVYWNMNLSGLAIVDPYWNYSTLNEVLEHNPQSSTTATPNVFGFVIQIKAQNVYLYSVNKTSTCTCTNALLYSYPANATLKNVTFTGNVASFGNYSLNYNERYIIVCGKNGGSYTRTLTQTSLSYPITTGAYINISSSATDELLPFKLMTDSANNLLSITTYQATYINETISSTNLLIDNAHANITTECGAENHNYTAWNNVSMPIWIMYNNTHASDGTGSTQWYASLISGVWNITANTTGNGTINASSDWLYHTITLGTAEVDLQTNASNNMICIDESVLVWCNSTDLEEGVLLWLNNTNLSNPEETIPRASGNYIYICNWSASDCYASGSKNLTLTVEDCEEKPNTTLGNMSTQCCPISTLYCRDNDTLAQMWDIDGVQNWAYKYCSDGCDNKTFTCNPPEYQQDLYNLLIIIGFIVFMILMFAWTRGRRR